MGIPVTIVLGLGRQSGDALAARFAETGHHVLAADGDSERLETARHVLPDDVQLHHGELHTRKGIKNALTAAVERFGRIDNLVIVPAVEEADEIGDVAPDKLLRAYERTSVAAALALKIFADHLGEQSDLPQMGVEHRRQKGTVTFVLSYSAQASMPGHFSETATQGAVLAVMRAAALDLAEREIRVNAVIAIRPRDERAESYTPSRTPLRRGAQADEIADAVRYLASPEAAIVTGATLVLDGGRQRLSGILD